MASPRSSSSSLDSPTSPVSPMSPTSLLASSSHDSTTALVLLPDSEDSQYDPDDIFDTLDDDDEQDTDTFQLESTSAPATPSLSLAAVFLYLLAPFLRLGALYIPTAHIALGFTLASLIFFALLSVFCRQIWYLLSRYLRKPTIDDILLELCAKGRHRGVRRVVTRRLTSSVTGLLRLLLANMYLRESVNILLTLVPDGVPLHSRWIVSSILSLVVFGLSSARSLADKKIVYATSLSVLSYVLWLTIMSYGHAKGMLSINPALLRQGVLWDDITTIAFAFTTSSTLFLGTALKGGPLMPTSHKKEKRPSFQLLNIASAALALALTIPLAFISHSNQHGISGAALTYDKLIAALHASTLILSIPSIVVTTPVLPVSPQLQQRLQLRKPTRVLFSQAVFVLAATLLDFVPAIIMTLLSDVALVLALAGTYFAPALIHITTHYFRRPLSIVVPTAQRRHHRQSSSQLGSTPATPRSTGSPIPPADPLLQRKEHALQRRRLGRRLLWDAGVWLLLVPVSGCAMLWMGGRLARQW